MTGMVANLMLNILIVALLAVTIGYCWVLNRRIKILQDSKSELAQLLKYFDESTERAAESIVALQSASKKIGENIQQRIDKANFLLDDLSFMIEKGNKLADQMEAGFAVDRAKHKVEHEKDVEPPLPAKSEKISSRERTAASLEAVLERVVGRNKQTLAVTEEQENTRPRRSKTEQELLDMLRSGGGLKG